jgi:hypothetical protein
MVFFTSKFPLHGLLRRVLGVLYQGTKVLRTRAHLGVGKPSQLLMLLSPVLFQPDLIHQIDRAGHHQMSVELNALIVNQTKVDQIPIINLITRLDVGSYRPF